MTAAANLQQVSLIAVAKKPSLSTTLAAPVAKFAAGFVDPGGVP
jgi:hypothetical protein